MCGICGIVDFSGRATGADADRSVRAMMDRMARRGPDDSGQWRSPRGDVRLGFRRLAILDLTAAGHQPMLAQDGRSVIVFNGEIYNYLELRAELEALGVVFRSTSDTEVLLEALSRWGVDALPKLNGMFAFGWYRLDNRTLLLARDHAGIKPLYYFAPSNGDEFCFASQFDCLFDAPAGGPSEVCPKALHLYLRLHHLPAPYGLYRDTHQLAPGCYLEVSETGALRHGVWWRLPDAGEPLLSAGEADEAVACALDRVLRRQRQSDVPLGTFLSGGIDSPLVTAVLHRLAPGELKSFTIGNPGWNQDETDDASAYARHLQVQHFVRPMSGHDALRLIEQVAAAQHEPFADFSILPTLFVSELAREQVTVALSGDGGDELFFGYERPLSLMRSQGAFRWPRAVRRAMYLAGRLGVGRRRSDVIMADTAGDYYFEVNSRLKSRDLRQLAPDLHDLPDDFEIYRSGKIWRADDLAQFSRKAEFYGQLQRCLKKMDMASMHHSLEVRVPLLDRELIEVALRIPPAEHLAGGLRKAMLVRSLGRHVPQNLLTRTKRGFAVPLGEWLRNELREMVEGALFNQSSPFDPYISQPKLRQYWNEHLSGRRDAKWGVWTFLGLALWAQRQTEVKSAAFCLAS
ncbi:MAG: asparagine synthase (glutamine-hydrolyzing) [Planctomycetia bacterium]|nr:asparagine synthase (glutamine-hydrolyzing) [Planctomycetia bacterium]